MIEERLFVPCKDHDIPMVLCVPQAEGSYPCMLLLHGFLSYKEGDGYLSFPTIFLSLKRLVPTAEEVKVLTDDTLLTAEELEE